MQLNYLSQALDHLGKTHFQKLWPAESVKVMALEVADIDDRAMVKTIARVMMEISPSTFPALKRITDILREEQVKINLSRSPEEAKTRKENDTEASNRRKGIGRMGFDSLRLIDALFDGKLTKENFIEGMVAFDQTFPCCGWKQQAGELAGYYSGNERYQEEERARYADV